jgi:hypothetical protein
MLSLRMDRLVSQKPQELHDQLAQINREGDPVRMEWRARKKDGTIVDLEVIGSYLDHQGKDQVLIFCREAEEMPQPAATVFREREPAAPPPRVAEESINLASNMMDELHTIARDIRGKRERQAGPEREKPKDVANQFDVEAKKLIKRIEEAMTKVEKIRRTSNNRPNA